MLILRMIRKFFAILKSCQSPVQIALGVILGMAIGLAPLGLHTVFALSLAALFAISFSSCMFAFGFFKLLGYIIWQPAYVVGFFVLERMTFIHPLLDRLFQMPLIALCHLNRYTLFGSYVIALLLSPFTYILIKRGLKAYRGGLSDRVENSKLYLLISKSFLFRFFRWLFMAGEAKFHEPAKDPFLPFRYVRKQMLVILPVLYFLTLFAGGALANFFVDTVGTKVATKLTGGSVHVSGLELNPFTGRFTMGSLQVQDPNTPDENIINITGFHIDISMMSLLSSRLVAEIVEFEEINLHVKREEDGSLNLDGLEDVMGHSDDPDYQKYQDWVQSKAKDVDWMQVVKKYLSYRTDAAEHKRAQEEEATAMDWDFDSRRSVQLIAPLLEIRDVRIGALNLNLSDALQSESNTLQLSGLHVTLNDFSSHPAIARQKLQFDVKGTFNNDPQRTCQVIGAIDYSKDGYPKELKISIAGINLPAITSMVDSSMPITVRRGTALLESKIMIQGDGSLLASNLLQLSDVILKQKQGSGFLDLNHELTGMAIEAVNEFSSTRPITITFPVGGTATEPDFTPMEQAMKIALRDYVLSSGKGAWKAIAGEWSDLADIPLELPNDFEAFSKQIEQISGILKAGDDENSVEDKVEDAVKGLLDGLWKKKND